MNTTYATFNAGTWLLVGALTGCYSGNATANRPGGSRDAGVSNMDSAVGDVGPVGADLPCDIAVLLATQCASCHNRASDSQSETPMMTYADLIADSSEPGQTVAQFAVARMRDNEDPMPPSPETRSSETEIAALEAWVTGGYPHGSCDPGTIDVDAGMSVFDVAPICTSTRMWTGGNRESPLMHPGKACITCHTDEDEGPIYSIAGTLFPTAHEPDDCNGAAGSSTGAVVIITDANGVEKRLTPNSVGNFYTTARIAMPYKAKVVVDGVERRMNNEQDDGDCNTCHTQNGEDRTPGRIILP